MRNQQETNQSRGVNPQAQRLFQQATQAHQTGQWERAADYYRQVLVMDPRHADSLHLLGLVVAEQQQLPKALELLNKALALSPNNAIFYCNRAQIHRRMQQLELAIADYQQALLCAPRRAETYAALAETCLLANRSQDAILHYLYACYLNPQQPVSVHHHLGNAFLSREHFDAAILAYEKALALNPHSIETLSNLGVVYVELGQFDKAVTYQQQALSVNANYADGYINLGLALSQQTRFIEAEQAYQQALQLSPSQASAIHGNRGLNFQAQMEWQKALDCFNQALQDNPANVKAQFNRATLSLLLGDYQQGWQDYEIRFKLNDPNHPVPNTTQPNWQGEDLTNKTILVYCEQGLGDTLQFIRYLPLLKQRGARIILQTQPALIPFLQTQAQLGITHFLAMGQALPIFDYHVSLMSLPQRFNTSIEAIPAAPGYLQVPMTNVSVLPASNAKLKIGLVWAGNPQHKNDRRRSIALQTFKPLFTNSALQFYSLQYGPRTAEIIPFKDRLIDLSPQMTSWLATAQLIQQLDLVITVDTAAAHLSAAMGKPTWLLLPFIPDFRWLLDRRDSPWYESMRLFRQPKRDDWDSIITMLKAALAEHLNISTAIKH